MKIDILTLFPEMFEGILNNSIIKRAVEKSQVTINLHNFREYSKDPHHKVDDYGYGGGKGMVLMPEPIMDAIDDLKQTDSLIVMMTPQGQIYNQRLAYQLVKYNHIIIICGHYEGFDERIRTIVDLEISIGDYILTGGEIASMALVDSVVRLVDGVIDPESHQNESFNDNLLDYPVYTKPQEFRGLKVPEVLLSGHHENIANWRKEEQIKRTEARRPDLLERDD